MSKIRTLIKIIITGSATMILTACYGVYMPLSRFKGKLQVTNKASEPITGIKVSYESAEFQEVGYTDKNGDVEYDIDSYGSNTINFKFEDIDGTDNLGEFKPITQEIAIEAYVTKIQMEE
jgi:hypothetical protein